MAPRTRGSATMADIARLSGVSVTTVSHVMNRTRPVRQETEAAVLSAAGQLGYQPAGAASGPTGRVLGVASSAFSNPSFSELLHGIEQVATRNGYSLLLSDTHDDAGTELRAMTELIDNRVQAVLLAPSPAPATALSYARTRDVPVVLLDRMVDADVDQVGSDNIDSVGQLVDHLAELGHTRIAMISGMPGLSTTEERIEGFRRSARRHGIEVTDGTIVSGRGTDDRSQEAMTSLMTSAHPPTAVVTGNNRATIGAMRAARQLGIEVPRDVALVAYDDFDWADLFHPRLTVIAQPTTQIGESAVDLAVSRILDPDRAPRRLTLATTFVHRESCGCHPHDPR
ncbi:LacI family DNA-binding transcriptional regulator [Microlunatus antarcticus]|uniref:LacI family transcriptional regulator n=1 Tax=Microlunatus antarcticus TaxID=53388 RepID=A0A7W5JRV1_9ACTN|nr:LacI family transcriptional regulator [Microlunatus antarcticus]